MKKHPCKVCLATVLSVRCEGRELTLDVASRGFLYELADADETTRNATPVRQQEIYIAHAYVCRHGTQLALEGV